MKNSLTLGLGNVRVTEETRWQKRTQLSGLRNIETHISQQLAFFHQIQFSNDSSSINVFSIPLLL